MSRSSPIHLAAARDHVLACLASGEMGLEAAAESAGVHPKTLRRYAISNPEFAAKLEAAAIGEPYEPEGEPREPVPAVIDAEVVGERPSAMAPVKRPPPPGEPALGDMSRAEFQSIVIQVLRDPEHPAWGKLAPMAFRYFHGAEMIKRETGAGEAEQTTRVLVIRVPVPETGAR